LRVASALNDKNRVPVVSVILPFYNRAATLARCVDGVLAQTFADWELVAVDDASADDGAAVIEKRRDARIRIIRHETNRGAGAARDTAMRAANGGYFALLDSDDEWLPGKLAAQVAALQRPGETAALSACRYEFIRDGCTIVWPKPFDPASWERSLHRECTFGFGTTLVIRRDVALRLGGFDPELPRHEDWDWVLRAIEGGETIAFVPEVLARVHSTALPPLDSFIRSTHRFLAKHDAGFARFGAAHRRRVTAYHFESVASMAYEQRAYSEAHGYLLRSFATWPWRSPLPLAALPLGVVDSVCGTRLVQRAAAIRRALFGEKLDAEVAA
jgi:glycosyltransferase involved in cell wall biosynthesis